MVDRPACVGCRKFDSAACERCNWHVEYQLIKEHGSFEQAFIVVNRELQDAKPRCFEKMKTLISDLIPPTE